MKVQAIMLKYRIPKGLIELEITETVFFNEKERMLEVMRNLKEFNMNLSIDDFGSGYSSLNMLKDMPVDVLKIDMKFLSKSRDDEKARTILQNIINLSEDLGIASLTEGVETEDQYRMLREMGCEMFQGYYFAKPMPLEEFEEKYLD